MTDNFHIWLPVPIFVTAIYGTAHYVEFPNKNEYQHIILSVLL